MPKPYLCLLSEKKPYLVGGYEILVARGGRLKLEGGNKECTEKCAPCTEKCASQLNYRLA
jgi:hypothetical protein